MGYEIKPGEMLSEMLLMATQKHHGQFDKGGHPYILHPLKVMYLLKTTDEELQCIALGHDLVEDTDTTYEMLREKFSSRVVEGIRCMTKLPGQTKAEYLVQVCSNTDSMKVKMSDLRHNSDIRRLKGVTEKDLARVVRYQKMYREIKFRLENCDKILTLEEAQKI